MRAWKARQTNQAAYERVKLWREKHKDTGDDTRIINGHDTRIITGYDTRCDMGDETGISISKEESKKVRFVGRGVGKPFSLEPPASPDAGKPARPKRKSAFPKDFTPNDDGYRLGDELLGDRAPAEFDKFRDHHLRNGSVFADWDAAWRTWVRRADEFHRERRVS
jgi:hypothetical protein